MIILTIYSLNLEGIVVKLPLWVLDLNDEHASEGTSEIHLRRLDDKDHRVLLVDRSFKPRFYLTLDEEADENMIIETIRNMQFPGIIEVIK